MADGPSIQKMIHFLQTVCDVMQNGSIKIIDFGESEYGKVCVACFKPGFLPIANPAIVYDLLDSHQN